MATTWPGLARGRLGGELPVYLQERQRSFAPLAAVDYRRFNLAAGDAPERVLGAGVSHDYFAVFGLAPVLGRTLHARRRTPRGATGWWS